MSGEEEDTTTDQKSSYTHTLSRCAARLSNLCYDFWSILSWSKWLEWWQLRNDENGMREWAESMRISLKINEHAFGVESIKIKPIYSVDLVGGELTLFIQVLLFGESGMCGNIRRVKIKRHEKSSSHLIRISSTFLSASSRWRTAASERRRIKSSGRMNEN